MPDLILTNGDTAADLLAAAGFEATILPWRDVLHEGPVVPAQSLEALSEIRAGYLAQRFDLEFAAIRAEFGARDAILRSHARFDNIAVWLEHDLYDQLQLIQILDFFCGEGRGDGLSLVQADDFLGQQTPASIRRFAVREQKIGPELLSAGRQAFAAVAAATPETVFAAEGSWPLLPHLGPALDRFLQELPAPGSGLTRSEATALELIAEFKVAPGALFREALRREEAAFMGDWSFFRILDDLAFAAEPLVSGLSGRFPAAADGPEAASYLAAALDLTPLGRAVLAGESDHIAINGVDRWWGGTRLSGADCWRYDRQEDALLPPSG